MKEYFIYILSNNRNGTLYVGVTNNLTRRIFEHKNKLILGFTSKYGLDNLVYYEGFNNIEDAIRAEKKIKGWVRKRKIELIKNMNPNWIDLDSSLHSE